MIKKKQKQVTLVNNNNKFKERTIPDKEIKKEGTDRYKIIKVKIIIYENLNCIELNKKY